MKRNLWRAAMLGGLVLAGLGALAPSAQADLLTWDWTWTSTLGFTDSGSGTLTTGPLMMTFDFGDVYRITAMTGTFDGSTITGLISPETFADNDNFLYPTLHPSFVQLDVRGVAFSIPSDKVNFHLITAVPIVGVLSYGIDFASGGFGRGIFTATFVPEPASLALLGTALAGLALLRRRKRAA